MGDRVVILGGGNLGKELKKRNPGWELVTQESAGIKWRCDDLNEWSALREAMSKISESADVIINTVAYTDTYGDDWDLAYDLNVHLPTKLVMLCFGVYADAGAFKKKRFIHISTDYVYANGGTVNYPQPLQTAYAVSKFFGDINLPGVSGMCRVQIVRGSFKPNPWPWHKAYTDVIGNFVYIDQFAYGVEQVVLEGDKMGRYIHVGTKHSRSLHDMAKETNPKVIKALAPEKFPKNVSLPNNAWNIYLEPK